MSFKFALALVVVSLLSTAPSRASTYDLTLTNSNGTVAGSGQFTVSGGVSNSGLSNFVEGVNLTSLDFKIGGNDFTLNDDLTAAVVTFDKGNLISIAYLGVLGNFKFDLGTLGLGYTYLSDGRLSLGTISLGSSGAAATPLPASWLLTLLGLIGVGFLAYRRQPKAGPALA